MIPAPDHTPLVSCEIQPDEAHPDGHEEIAIQDAPEDACEKSGMGWIAGLGLTAAIVFVFAFAYASASAICDLLK